MAAAGTSPALNLREKLAELAGLKQRVSPDLVRCDFTNLVTNGGFDTDTDWTKGTGWTIGSGVATGAAGTASNLLSLYNSQQVEGRRYFVSADVVVSVAGNLYAAIAGNSSPDQWGSTSGAKTTAITAGASVSYLFSFFKNSTFAGTVDNATVYEADPSDDAPWLRLPYGYKVGTRGMIVRDGVILHPSDYTEITDSGQTWIKPIVAPGVSTEFSIWAGA